MRYSLIISSALLFLWSCTSDQSGTAIPHEKGIAKVTQGEIIQRVTMAGVVVPRKRTVIMAPYSGYVRKLYVKIGDRVRQGDPLVSVSQTIDSKDPLFPLRAPFPGTVVNVEKSEGEYAREGDTKDFILRIDDTHPLFVMGSASEIDRTRIRVGMEVVIKASAILTHSYKGIIREVALSAKEKERWERNQGDFPVRAEVLDQDQDLRPGMSVVMDVISAKKKDILTLGYEYLRKEKDQYSVTLKNGEKRPVRVGLQNEEAFEITEGLKEGDLVRAVDFASLIKAD